MQNWLILAPFILLAAGPFMARYDAEDPQDGAQSEDSALDEPGESIPADPDREARET